MLEKFDLYGQKINLKFKGRDSYKTKFGGVLSLLLIAGMTAYTISRFVVLVQRSEQKNSFNEIYHNITDLGELTGEQISYQFGYTFFDSKS